MVPPTLYFPYEFLRLDLTPTQMPQSSMVWAPVRFRL